MAQRTVARPIYPFLPPEMFNPAPIGAQPVPMQPPAQPLAGAPRRVPTTIEPMQGLGPMGAAPQAAAASAMPMPGAPQGGGFMGNLKGGLNDFLGSDASLAMAAGLLGGGSTSQAIGRGFGNAFQARQKEAPATTDYLTEYAFAKREGYTGSFPDFLTMRSKAGAQNININSEKLTEGQSKDVGFYARGRAADNDLASIEGELTSLWGSAAAEVPLGNYAKTPQYQQAERAGREFLAVVLRKDTGAAVTPAEFDLYGPMYLPQPGDDPPAISDKRKARARAMESIKLGLGTARPLAEEIDAELGPVPAAAGASAAPAVTPEAAEAELRRRGLL